MKRSNQQCALLARGKMNRGNCLRRRRGSVLTLVAFFMVVLVAMAAFSVDVAYMQLVNTQLRTSTDVAAKAGTSYLMQGKSESQAVQYAIDIAAKNTVAGKSLYLNPSDITLGQSQLQSNGSWSFVAGLKPYQAMQINSKLTNNNSNGAVKLFFGPLLGKKRYTTSTTSVATAFACDVSLVLDRSGSMKWDMSGVDDQYPWGGKDNKAPVTGSRWMALDSSVKSFTDLLSTSSAPPRVGVVTWASDVTTDLGFTTSMSSVYSAVHKYTDDNFDGMTNMCQGMQYGVAQLTGSTARSTAKKIMVLMSDGDWNEGSDPVAYASTAAANNITIYTISLLTSGTGTRALQSIANATGGKSYYANDSASLNSAWTDIAYSLPIVLTK